MFNLADHEIIQLIHEGNDCAVYRAIPVVEEACSLPPDATSQSIQADQLSQQNSVILKILPCSVGESEDIVNQAIQAYEWEYDLLNSHHLPQTIKIHQLTFIDNISVLDKSEQLEQFQAGKHLIISSEDFGGISLAKLWEKSGDLNNLNICNSLADFLKLAMKIVLAIGEIHQAAIIHHQLTAEHILYNPTTEIVKIIDFKLATFCSDTNYSDTDNLDTDNNQNLFNQDWQDLGFTLAKLVKTPGLQAQYLQSSFPAIISRLTTNYETKYYDSVWKIVAELADCLHQLTTNQSHPSTHLHTSDTTLKQFLDAIPVGISIHQPDGQVAYFNQAGKAILGTAENEAIGEELATSYQIYRTSTQQLYPLAELPAIRALRGETVIDDDIEVHIQDKIILGEIRSTPIFDEHGQVIYSINAFTDITERKQNEQLLANYSRNLEIQVAERTKALRESEAKFRAIFEQVAVGINQADRHGRFMRANSCFCRMLGYTLPEILQLSYQDITHVDDIYPTQLLIERLYARQISVATLEKRYIHKNGSLIWVQLTLSLLRNADGEVISDLAIVQDISDRQAEREKRQVTEKQLMQNYQWQQESTRILEKMRQSLDIQTIFHNTTENIRQALQCSRVIIYRFNSDYSGEFTSESVETGWIKLLDKIPVCTDTYLQTIEGRSCLRATEVITISNIYEAGLEPCHIQLLESLQARSLCVVPVFTGEKLWGLLGAYHNAQFYQWQTGEIELLKQAGMQFGVAIQQAELFTQINQQSQELAIAKQMAEQANQAKSIFIANMSHELRTPLNAILGFSELTKNSAVLPPQLRENLEIIHQSGEHLLTLINDILEISKIEAGKETLNLQNFDIYSLLRDIENLFSLKVRKKAIQLVIEYTNYVPQYIYSDPVKLRIILMNLISNAIKFTEEGKVVVKITGDFTQPPQSGLTFVVEDTGEGIEKEAMAELFTPFFQSRSGKKSQEGTGLGLAISQKFIELMGGYIQLTSQVNQGTKVLFYLPISETAEYPWHNDQSPTINQTINENCLNLFLSDANGNFLTNFNQETLKVLPNDWRENFLEKLQAGDIMAMENLVVNIQHNYPQIATELAQLIRNYAFTELLDMFLP
jgi:PAS domain S-box-containing protein